MPYSMSLRNGMIYHGKHKKRKIKVGGKEYDESEFDDTFWRERRKKKGR